MDRRSVVAVIPARYGSSRFPGKPLALLAGRPMIAHVVARAMEAACFDRVVVATDDERVAAAAREAGAVAALTGPCASGTDRVAEATAEIDAAVVINVQGDEPAIPPANLRCLAELLIADPAIPMATLALPASAADLADPNVVKVVCAASGDALYFSRAPIPYPRTTIPGLAMRHVGLYGFQREALVRFASWPRCELEKAEELEQLRALVNGMAIRVLPACGESVAVDKPADVPRAEAALATLARSDGGGRHRGGDDS